MSTSKPFDCWLFCAVYSVGMHHLRHSESLIPKYYSTKFFNIDLTNNEEVVTHTSCRFDHFTTVGVRVVWARL